MSDIERHMQRLSDWSITALGVSGGVSATRAAVPGEQHVLTQFSFSSDAACLVTVESPAGTVLWQRRLEAAGGGDVFYPTGLRGALGQALVVRTSASTSNSAVSGVGYSKR